MPELPDLVYIRKHLAQEIVHSAIAQVTIREPIVLRVAIDMPFEATLIGSEITAVDVHGPFLRFGLSRSVELILNLMLAGKLQLQGGDEKPFGHLCVALHLSSGQRLNLCDDQKMAKVYVVRSDDYRQIPRYREQGVDILSPEFTPDRFRNLAKQNSRKQVRVFINDQSILSAIGNAYADEILFEAGIHPKTFVNKLSAEELQRLYEAIINVIKWGIEKVEAAHQPIHVKVRDHMRVRNRRGEPCPRCGTTIRREGVRGHDVFFCPSCQPASRKMFIDWKRTQPVIKT
ncbi:MAG TPA: DNA-formamidopyrimidine glycosylase family protein [Bacteroidota bacterium]|nr:DNA-formamidopyrimidine glycosylase family protein [Bacteroidota bacterium]